MPKTNTSRISAVFGDASNGTSQYRWYQRHGRKHVTVASQRSAPRRGGSGGGGGGQAQGPGNRSPCTKVTLGLILRCCRCWERSVWLWLDWLGRRDDRQIAVMERGPRRTLFTFQCLFVFECPTPLYALPSPNC